MTLASVSSYYWDSGPFLLSFVIHSDLAILSIAPICLKCLEKWSATVVACNTTYLGLLKLGSVTSTNVGSVSAC